MAPYFIIGGDSAISRRLLDTYYSPEKNKRLLGLRHLSRNARSRRS
jgi:hypothetical protein